MTTKPTKYPDFAMDDVVDPTSGQPNIIEPSTGKKSAGWVYNEKPPRQYFNWLSRLTSQWIRFLDANKAWHFSGTFDVSPNTYLELIEWNDPIDPEFSPANAIILSLRLTGGVFGSGYYTCPDILLGTGLAWVKTIITGYGIQVYSFDDSSGTDRRDLSGVSWNLVLYKINS